MATDLSVIIPAYNEAAGIPATLAGLRAEPRLADAELIVVDDGSDDETGSLAEGVEGVTVLRHRVNRGYGSAILTGVRASSRGYICWYDADGQHRPEDLLKIYDTLVNENLDYCVGVRDTRSHHVQSRQFGKAILRWVVNVAAGEPITDFNSGLRGFRREVLVAYLHLLPKGFSASTTTTLIMKERGYIGADVPIVVTERVGTSSVKQVRDGVRTLMIILRLILLFKPLLFFGSIGAFLIVTGSVYGFVEAISLREGFPVFGALVIILGVQALFFGLLGDQISQFRRERFEDYE